MWRNFAQLYERVTHDMLQNNAEIFGFRLLVLRVAVSACSMQRVLVLHGEAAPTGPRGEWLLDVPSPPAWSLYCLPVLDNFVRRHPRVMLDVFIDDSHQSPREAPRRPRNTCVSSSLTTRQRSFRLIGSWRCV